MRNDLNLALPLLRNLHGFAEVSDTAINFDFVPEELLERGDIEDLVTGRLRSIDDELDHS